MINYLYFIFYYSVCTSNYTVNITHSWNNYTYTLNFLQNEINDMYKTHISWIILNWYKENYKIDGKIRTECLTVSNFVHNNNIYITINCITGMTNGNLSTHNETILITKDDFLTELAHINIFLWIMMGVLLLIITYILYMLLIMIPLIKNFQEDNSENDMEEAEQDVEEIIDINTNIPNTTNNNIESNIENTFFYKILYIKI